MLAIAKWSCMGGFAFFLWLFYELYWKYRNQFNEEDRYFDPENMVVYHAENKFILIPAVFCIVIFIIIHYIIGAIRRRAAITEE